MRAPCGELASSVAHACYGSFHGEHFGDQATRIFRPCAFNEG